MDLVATERAEVRRAGLERLGGGETGSRSELQFGRWSRAEGENRSAGEPLIPKHLNGHYPSPLLDMYATHVKIVTLLTMFLSSC